ncbi:MAG: hypothetical protein WCO11_07425 [Sphingomonadales bacterium]|jgi:hypothetical protein
MGGIEFIVALTAISTAGWVFNSWIRARHGYPITDESGQTVARLPDSGASIDALTAENQALRGRLERLEQRLQVLERIATDAPARLTAEIETLR